MKTFYYLSIVITLTIAVTGMAAADDAFQVGYAERDISPPAGLPMWGYGARHDLPSEGTKDPLHAKIVVIEAGDDRMAIVGLDLGRSPTFRSMAIIREGARKSGVNHVLLVGSHTHHGPVLELIDEPGLGQGKFDNAIAYVADLERNLIEGIHEASNKLVPAKIGWASENVPYNRNRQSKKPDKPTDPELAVIRFDDLDDKPIAILVNFAAHPVWADIMDRRWTTDWPGYMQSTVETDTGTPTMFLQGAAGDMSPNGQGVKGFEALGEMIGKKVVEINEGLVTKVPESPSIQEIEEGFEFESRVALHNPVIQGLLKQAFFPEMMAMLVEIPDNIVRPRMSTVLLNGNLALVGASGEFFCAHANRLKAESKAEETFFLGYCNGHQMYFPTREAIEEGGYGADEAVSWVSPGAGESMIDKALENIEALLAAH